MDDSCEVKKKKNYLKLSPSALLQALAYIVLFL